jgi:hypothetical protein
MQQDISLQSYPLDAFSYTIEKAPGKIASRTRCLTKDFRANQVTRRARCTVPTYPDGPDGQAASWPACWRPCNACRHA